MDCKLVDLHLEEHVSPADWAALQHDLLVLFQIPGYWILLFFVAGALILSLIGAFVGFMDARFSN